MKFAYNKRTAYSVKKKKTKQKKKQHLSCFTKRHFSQGFFQAFEAGFEWVAVAKISLCLSLDFGGNDGALIPMLARL